MPALPKLPKTTSNTSIKQIELDVLSLDGVGDRRAIVRRSLAEHMKSSGFSMRREVTRSAPSMWSFLSAFAALKIL